MSAMWLLHNKYVVSKGLLNHCFTCSYDGCDKVNAGIHRLYYIHYYIIYIIILQQILGGGGIPPKGPG